MTRMIVLALAGTLAAATALAETVAFTGATVHPVSGPEIPNGTVIVTDGRIAEVGAGVAVPAGATVVDLAGKHLYPGFVAPQSILGLTEIGSVRGTNDYQETGRLNPNIRAEIGYNGESELIPVARYNGLTSVLVVPRGGAVTGTSALMTLDGWNWEDMTLKREVALHVSWPAMSPSQSWWETRSPEEQKKSRDEAIEAIQTAFDDARAYWKARDAERLAGIPRHDRDVRWDAFGRALKGEIPVAFHAASLAQIRAVLKFVDEQKLTRVVLVGGADAAQVADELKARNIAVITDGILALPRRRWEPYDQAYALPAQLHRAGIRFAISDGGTETMNARNLPYEAAMAASFGLPRDEALKSVTLYPAEILGVADLVGSIQPGRRADLMVTNGDPLEIETTVEQVWIAGRLTSGDNRQTRLWKRYDNRPRGELARKR